jgi:hypothetical protein
VRVITAATATTTRKVLAKGQSSKKRPRRKRKFAKQQDLPAHDKSENSDQEVHTFVGNGRKKPYNRSND